jgi:hypothetical protein
MIIIQNHPLVKVFLAIFPPGSYFRCLRMFLAHPGNRLELRRRRFIKNTGLFYKGRQSGGFFLQDRQPADAEYMLAKTLHSPEKCKLPQILGQVLIGKVLCQPLERIHLDTIDPDFEMEMRTGDPSSGADLPDQLPGLDVVPDRNKEF